MSTRRIRQRRRLLLVDDDASLSATLRMLFEGRGFEVTSVSNAEEAVREVSPGYDLVILDLVLPDGDGLRVCEEIKRREDVRHIPVIMMSAQALSEDRVQALYLGADDFLSKPMAFEELLARIEAVLRRTMRGGRTGLQKDGRLLQELRRILDEGLLVNYFQPIYRIRPFGLFGIEMLTRPATQCPLRDPEIFFRSALEYGLYTELETLSWTMALGRLATTLNGERIFLNCDPYFIESSRFLLVRSLFRRNRIAPEKVVLEITERSAISDYKAFFEHLRCYRRHGFNFAVDDVGGGYASLESIVRTRPEVVKIDRHIVQGLHEDSFKRSIVKSVVSICRDNAIISVAEGVEARRELEVLSDLGVDAVQGYYLCRPTAEIDLKRFADVSLDPL